MFFFCVCFCAVFEGIPKYRSENTIKFGTYSFSTVRTSFFSPVISANACADINTGTHKYRLLHAHTNSNKCTHIHTTQSMLNFGQHLIFSCGQSSNYSFMLLPLCFLIRPPNYNARI